VVKTLQRKLVRDLWRLRAQGFTIAVLVGCGIASFVAAVTASASLEASLADFYADARFGDLFVHLTRAPRPVLDRLRDLPAVAAAEGRTVATSAWRSRAARSPSSLASYP
jgi:putative ABC transport system permease protein